MDAVSITVEGPGAREGGGSGPAAQRPLGRLWFAVRAHPLVVGLVIAATVLGALVWLAMRSPNYRATAEVLVSPRPQDDQLFIGLSVIKDTGEPTRTIQTAAALLESPEAARLAARRLGPPWSEQRVLSAIDIQPQGESNILDVMATADSSAEAAMIANAFVAATLDQRDRALRRQAGPLIEQLTRARRDLSPADRDTAADVDTRVRQLLEVRGDGDPTIELAQRATVPQAPEGASRSLILLLALMVGSVLASVAALVVELLGPPRVTSELELAKITRLPILARVPKLRRWSVRGRSRGPPPLSSASMKAFRALPLQLELALENEPRVVMLSSAGRGDGTTTSVVQFGQTLASTGNKTLLVDLDLGRPQLAHALGVTPDRDLLDFVSDDTRGREPFIDVRGQPGLSLVVASRSASEIDPEQVMERLRQLLRRAGDEFTYVLLDAPPLTEVGSALRSASVADAVLLVVRLGRTTAADLEIAGDMLDRIDRQSTGFIVVRGQPTSISGATGVTFV
jgi:Mrp family chromosome partitioning ATPase